ncbi:MULTISPECIES: DUF6042 family protein [unclassified Streptosporangium]|uniref:DUF6042 family protein n=1 Tax=Streptosporangium sp. NPDC005286 TaxID=3154463 RepID=UPI0033ADBD56
MTADDDGHEPRYRINPAAPLPAEVLALTADERAEEDHLYWSDLYQEAEEAAGPCTAAE